MHPEQAPGPDRSPERPERAPDEHDLRQNFDDSDGDEPRDADEHAAAANSPIDHSMLDALDATADPAREQPAPDGESAPASVEEEAPAPSVGSEPADAATPPAAALTAPKKKRRKRRRKKLEPAPWIPEPPVRLTPTAQNLWERLLRYRLYFDLATDLWMLARYCLYLELWYSAVQVLNTKGLVYLRQQRPRGDGAPPVDSIRLMPHADFMLRLEYVLVQHERILGIDRNTAFTIQSRQAIPSSFFPAP